MADPASPCPPAPADPERLRILETLLAAGGEPLAVFDPAGRLLVAAGPFADAAPPPDRLDAAVRRVAATGLAETLAGPRPDDAALRLAPAMDADGRVRAVTLTAGTGREVVQALRRELADARAEAARARADKGRFLSAASHDLRQPFQAMQLFHHLLAARLDDPAARDLAGKLGQAMQAAESLLTALIEVARLDDGMVAAETRDFDVDEVLARVADEFAPQAEDLGLRFLVHPCGRRAHSDPALLERLLRPALANALDCTARGGVLIGARRRGDRLRVEVWDTGIGIPPAELAAVWADFHRIDRRVPHPRHGAGLGLPVARRIAAILDHPLTLRSRPGRGTVFTVDMPLAGAGREP